MIEQLNLFGERDPLAAVAEWITSRYERVAKEEYAYPISFDEWLLRKFSSYEGSNCNAPLGYSYWSFDPSGFRLTGFKEKPGESYSQLYFPKDKILKACGVKK